MRLQQQFLGSKRKFLREAEVKSDLEKVFAGVLVSKRKRNVLNLRKFNVLRELDRAQVSQRSRHKTLKLFKEFEQFIRSFEK
jgi:hypothetical protein